MEIPRLTADSAMQRRRFVQLALGSGTAAALAGCGLQSGSPGAASSGKATYPPLSKENKNMTVIDFAGDNIKSLLPSYAAKYGLPKYTFTTSDANTLAMLKIGQKADVSIAYGIVGQLVDLGLIIPWDTSLIPNFGQLYPSFVSAGTLNGKQYLMPSQWGFESAVYRPDIVTAPDSYEVLFDEKYAGKIAWLDNPLVEPAIAGILHGFPDPFNMTDAQLSTIKKFLISKKHLVKLLWVNSTDLEAAFKAGDIYVGHAWPSSWATLQGGKHPVGYLKPKTNEVAWSGGYILLKSTTHYHHAHEFINSVISPEAQLWAVKNFLQGPTSSKVSLSSVSPSVVKAFDLSDPAAIKLPAVLPEPKNISASTYQRYGAMWNEFKAA